ERAAADPAGEHPGLEAVQRPAVRAMGHAGAQGGRAGEVPDAKRLLPLLRQPGPLLVLRHRLGGSRHRGRVLLLLEIGGEVRPWLSRWGSWTTCTSSTACTAREAITAPRRPRCCGSSGARPAGPSARCT